MEGTLSLPVLMFGDPVLVGGRGVLHWVSRTAPSKIHIEAACPFTQPSVAP